MRVRRNGYTKVAFYAGSFFKHDKAGGLQVEAALEGQPGGNLPR